MYFLAIGAALAAAQVAVPAQSDASRIVVNGYGSVKHPPNVATLSYQVRREGQTSDEAVKALVTSSAAIEKGLRGIDRSLELHSDEVRVQSVRGSGCDESSYNNEKIHLSVGACAIVGYRATQGFDLRTARVDDAGTMVGLAARQGATSPSLQDFSLASSDEARRQAIADAMADAQAKALAIAQASGGRLGSILSVSLDGAQSRDSLNQLPSLESPAPVGERDEPIRVSLKPEPVNTTARVTVSYALQR